MNSIIKAALLGAAAISAMPATAATVGFNLVIADESGSTSDFDKPFFTLTNTSELADLLTFSLTLDATSGFNIDRVFNFSSVNGTAPSLNLTNQVPGQSNGGEQTTVMTLTYTGFNARNPDEGSRFIVEFDEGAGDTDEDFRTILFNNGGFANAIVRATFSDGQVVSLTLPDATNASANSFTFAATSAAVPEPATWAMMLGGFGLVGAAMRRRSRPMIAIA